MHIPVAWNAAAIYTYEPAGLEHLNFFVTIGTFVQGIATLCLSQI